MDAYRTLPKWRLLGMVLAAALTLIASAPYGWSQSSPSAYTTGYRYDGMHRLTGTISPDPDEAGSIAFGAVRNSYDTGGRLIKVEMGELASWQSESVAPSAWTGFSVFRSVETSYDGLGRKIKEQVRTGSSGTIFSVTQYSYDNAGRLLCTAVRMNAAVFGSLPSSACTLGTQGSNGPDRITKNVYDPAGEVVQIRKAVGTSLEQAYATYSYTVTGKREYVIDAVGNRAKLEYDGFDRQKKWIFPSTVKPAAYNPSTQSTALSTAGNLNAADYEQYGYDNNGNRTSFRKRDAQTILFTFDALNRATLKNIPNSTTLDVYYGYDLRGLQLYARFGSTSGQGVTSIYDSAGRLISSTTNMGGNTRALSYQYDADSNRTRITFPDSQYFTYSYDGLDRMTGILESGSTQVATIAYNNKGERTGLTGGVSTSYAYDGISRISSIAHDLSGASNDLTISLSSYNAANQLLARAFSNDAYVWNGSVNVNRNYTANGLNQYTAAGPASFGYDANGNLTSDGSSTYAYDVENRLTSATGANVVTMSYDPIGRLFQTSGGTPGTTQFLYNGDELVAEYNGSNALLRRYVHGPETDEPFFWYEGSAVSSTTRRILRDDHQGSIVSVASNSGTNLAINSYDEYGIPAESNLGRFAYTGQIVIPELGMYHYKARIYSPTLGRFLQTDPVGYEDQINLYAYVANDPLNKTDPTGMRDIYIGGADDKDATRIVQAYAERQMRLHPDRDIQYFSWADKKGIAVALERGIPIREPLNVIGHSLGGAEAIRQAAATSAKIDNLITIDPVSSAGNGSKPGNVAAWANVNAAPADRNFSDTVASTGRAFLGITNTSGADISLTSPSSHGDFPQMMGQIRGQQAIDSSYQNGSKQCTARTGVTC